MKCAWLLTGFVFCNCAMNVGDVEAVRRRFEHVRFAATTVLHELNLAGKDETFVLDDPTKITHYILTGSLDDVYIPEKQYVDEFTAIRRSMHGSQEEEFSRVARSTYQAYREKMKKGAMQLNVLAHLQKYLHKESEMMPISS